MPFCTNCGKNISDDNSFCSYCGAPVNTVSVVVNNSDVSDREYSMKEMNRLWNYFSEDFTKRETISSYNNTINELRADNAKQERLIRSNLSITKHVVSGSICTILGLIFAVILYVVFVASKTVVYDGSDFVFYHIRFL